MISYVCLMNSSIGESQRLQVFTEWCEMGGGWIVRFFRIIFVLMQEM